MEKLKRTLSLVLVVVMCFSLCVPIHAATSEFTGEDALVKIVGTSEGTTLTFDWQLTASKISGTQYILVTYDATQLTLLDCDKNPVTPNASVGGALNNFADSNTFLTNPGTLGTRGVSYTEMGCLDDGKGFLYLSAAPTAASTKFATGDSVLEFYFQLATGTQLTDLSQSSLRYVTAEEAGAHNQASAVNVHVVKDGEYDDDIGYNVSSSAVNWHFKTAPTLTVDGKELPAARVDLTSITLAAANATAKVPTNNTAAEIAFTATPNDGATIPATVSYKLYKDAAGTTALNTTGITVANNKVTIAKTAVGNTDLADGSNTVYLKADNVPNTVVTNNALALTITKDAPIVDSVTVSPKTVNVTLNANGTAPAQQNAAVTVKDQYGNTMSETVTPTGLPTGASWANGKLTFTTALRAGTSTVTFTAGSKNDTLSLVVAKVAAPAAPNAVGVKTTTVGGSDGKITGVDSTMEWKVNGAADSTYQAVTGTEITGLSKGKYDVRVKGTDFVNAGAVKTVEVGEPGKTDTPTVTISAPGVADGKVTVAENGSVVLTATVTPATGTIHYQWKKNGTNVGTDAATLTVTAAEADTYTCVVTREASGESVSDPATSNAITVEVKGKTNVEVAKKATASQTEGALNKQNLVTVTNGTWDQVKDAVTATVYKYVPAVEDDPETEEVETVAAHYEVVTGNLTEGTYYVDVAVAAISDQADYKVDPVAGKDAPEDTTAPADLEGYVVLTVNKASTGGGGVSGITVRYNVGEHGTLTGSATESVQRGKTPSKVPTVTAKDGYKFLGWSLDGTTVVDPTTVTITSSTTFTALYSSVKNTYISGYPDGTFRPDAQVTRAEVASMLARLSKDFDSTKTYTGSANDVASNTWFANFVNFGMEKGIISGYTDGTFRPDANITRGEFASMMARYMSLSGTGSATFADTTGHWAADSIAVLADKGIVNGYPDGGFHPDAQLTRAEAVQMINTALAVQALTGAAEVTPSDVASTHWAYTQILAAMNTDIKDIVK